MNLLVSSFLILRIIRSKNDAAHTETYHILTNNSFRNTQEIPNTFVFPYITKAIQKEFLLLGLPLQQWYCAALHKDFHKQTSNRFYSGTSPLVELNGLGSGAVNWALRGRTVRFQTRLTLLGAHPWRLVRSKHHDKCLVGDGEENRQEYG